MLSSKKIVFPVNLSIFLQRICFVVIEMKFSVAFPYAFYNLDSSSLSAFTDLVIDLDNE